MSEPTSPLRLAMAITELEVGGAERAFVRVAIGLKQLGWSVRIISLRTAGPLAAELAAAGIPVSALNCGRAWDVRAVPRMKAELCRNPADVLLTFLHQANIVGRIAARMAGIRKVVCSVRVADRRRTVSLPERLTTSLVSRYIAVSNPVAEVHAAVCRIDQQRLVVIRNGVDVASIDAVAAARRESYGCGPDDFVVLCAGRLTEQKAPGDVLAAFHGLLKRIDASVHTLRLCFVGDGPLRSDLERGISDVGFTGRVTFCGQRADLPAITKSANVLVLASRWEGLPNVVLEAHAARLPVIASAVDGTAEVVTDGITGRTFPPGDIERLADLIESAIENPQQSAAFAAAGRALVEREFQWEQCVMQHHRLLMDVIGPPPSE